MTLAVDLGRKETKQTNKNLLDPDMFCFENRVEPDQLASEKQHLVRPELVDLQDFFSDFGSGTKRKALKMTS